MLWSYAKTLPPLVIIIISSSIRKASKQASKNEILEEKHYRVHIDFHSNERSKVELRQIWYKIKFIDFPDLPQSTPDKLIDSGECNLCAFCAFDLSVFVLLHLQSFFCALLFCCWWCFFSGFCYCRCWVNVII